MRIVVLGCVLLLASCSSPILIPKDIKEKNKACTVKNVKEDCAGGFGCFAKMCTKFCTDNSGCTGGYACRENFCTKICTKDLDCSGGFACKKEVCELINTKNPQCSKSSDCKDSGLCVNGECSGISQLCGSKKECLDDFVCREDVCKVVRCDIDAQCISKKEYCSKGFCREKPPCAGVGCPAGQGCAEGACYKRCTLNTECPDKICSGYGLCKNPTP